MQVIPLYDEFKATPGNSARGGDVCFRCQKRVPLHRGSCWSKECKEFTRALKKSHLCKINDSLILVQGAIPYTKVCEFAEVPPGSIVTWVTTKPGHSGDLKDGEFLGVCESFVFTVTPKEDTREQATV